MIASRYQVLAAKTGKKLKTIMNHNRLITILTFCLLAQFSGAEIQQANPAEFQEMAKNDNVIVLDVRTPKEIAAGKIADASELNLYDADFKRKLSFLQSDKTILVYCRSGGRSSEVASILQGMGFEKIVNLDGGITAWNVENLPTIIPENREKAKPVEPINAAVFKTQLSQNNIVLLDFHTEWCTPCKRMAPVIDQLESDNKQNLKVIRIDLDANQALAEQYKVKAIPTFVIIKNGQEAWRHSGVLAQETIESHL